VIGVQASLGEQLLNVPVQGKTQIPTNRQKDDLRFKLVPPEQTANRRGQEKHLPAYHGVTAKLQHFRPRNAASYIMDTFPIVKKRDEQEHGGRYRTKDTMLEIYEAMAEATRTGVPYQSRLCPPPADASVAHPAKSLPVLGVS
jgi:hypothetical protein